MAKPVRRQWIKRTPELGGHALEPTMQRGRRSGWRCEVCKHQGANYKKLSSQRCDGSAASRWAMKALQLAEAEVSVGRGHTRVLSGKTLWCLTCGAFADTKAVGLTAECKGAPTVRGQGHYGGMWGQKRKLLKNIHPTSERACLTQSMKMVPLFIQLVDTRTCLRIALHKPCGRIKPRY